MNSSPSHTLKLTFSTLFIATALLPAHGAGTNPVTQFVVGKSHQYVQTAPSTTALNLVPYVFNGACILISNRSASQVRLTLPTGLITNLLSIQGSQNDFGVFGFGVTSNLLESTYPSGNYVFNVVAASGNQQVTVSLPALAQPRTPRVANYAACQSVNPSQAFTLTWDSFTGASGADYVAITGGGFKRDVPGSATSVQIPVGTLTPNGTHKMNLGFYRAVWITNGSDLTLAFRATVTQFSLITGTGSGGGVVPRLVDLHADEDGFWFDVVTTPGQTVTALYSTNLAGGQWHLLETVEADSDRVLFFDPVRTSQPMRFYRVRNGP